MWIDSMTFEEAERLMAQGTDIQTIRQDIFRRERYIEEYLENHPTLKKFYRTEGEVVDAAMRASLVKSQKLIGEANKKLREAKE